MARIKGQANYASNFEVLKQAPLDSRTVVSDSGDLIKTATWQDADGNVWLYDGLIVVVPNTNNPSAPEVYVLKDKDNYGRPDAWLKLGADNASEVAAIQEALKKKANLANGKVPANELPIVTSLKQDDYTTIPSAKLVDEALTAVGNTLEEKINNKVVGLLHWQGVKSTTSEIKSITSAKKGDVWHSNGDGSEWVCTQDITAANADAWTELGTPVNLRGYYTKTEVDKKVKPLADSIGTDSDVASANGSVYARISKNADDIDELRDAVGHIDSAQTATGKTVTQHTADISALQRALGNVVYDGCFSGELWLEHKKGSQFNIVFFAGGKTIERFPMPGDPVSSTGETYGAVVAVKEKPTATVITYNILWTNGVALYEIGIEEGTESDEYVCTSPAKKLCDDIYDYASKLSSGTLRDLYISAGAKYNEATGFYELNGLTDITEEQMRVIWQEDLSGWYLKGRTNLTRYISVRGSAGGYNNGIDISNICVDNINITKFNFGAPPYARYLDNAFSGCTKLETIDTRFPIIPFGGVVGPNIFRDCSALKEVRFNMRYLERSTNVKFPASPLISKDSILSVIQTTPTTGSVKPLVAVGLNESAYNRLKDDTDIQQALTEKNGFVTLTQI